MPYRSRLYSSIYESNTQSCNLYMDSSELPKLFGQDSGDLNEDTMTTFFTETKPTLEAWRTQLANVKNCLLKYYSRENRASIEENFMNFLDCTLMVCVDNDMLDILKETLIWMENVNEGNANEDNSLTNINEFKKNHEAMIRACEKNSFDLTYNFYRNEFRMSSLLSDKKASEKIKGQDETDILQELCRLRARAHPVYLLSESRHNHTDPVKSAFQLLYTINELKVILSIFNKELEQIAKDLYDFTLKLLLECSGKNEVELFLEQENDLDQLSYVNSRILPRIHAALILEHVDMVTCSVVQQVVNRIVYWRGHDPLDKTSILWKFGYVLRQIIGTPIFSIFHIVKKMQQTCSGHSRTDGMIPMKEKPKMHKNRRYEPKNPDGDYVGELCGSRKLARVYRSLADNFDVPINRLISHIACYSLFVIWILLLLSNPSGDNNNEINITALHIASFVWGLGYMAADLQVMFGSARSVDKNLPWYAKKRFQKFFGNLAINYQLFSHFIFFTGIAMEGGGYYLEQKYNWRPENLEQCDIDDVSSYKGYHIVNFGISFQSIGLILIIMQVLHLFRLHPEIGAVYVALKRCIKLMFSFILTHGVISLAFTLGLHFILRFSTEVCDANGRTIETGCESIFNLQRIELGLYCGYGIKEQLNDSMEIMDDPNFINQTVQCPTQCWRTFLENPTSSDLWIDNCSFADNDTVLVPKFRTDVDEFRIGRNFESLMVDKNRFYTFHESIKTVYWSLFSPGQPQVVGCSQGIFRYTALVMWAIYSALTATVLLNLLIAMMSVTMSHVQEDVFTNWKYHCTELWMSQCDKSLILPAPLNLLDLLVTGISRLFTCKCRRTERIEKSSFMRRRPREEYLELIRYLSNRYISDNKDKDTNNLDNKASSAMFRQSSIFD